MVARTAVHRPPSFSSLNPMLKPAVRGYLSAQGGAIHPSLHEGRQKLATTCDRQQRAMEQIEKPPSEAPPRPASIGMAGRLQLECPADIMGIRSPEAVWVVLRLELQGLRFSMRERFGRRGGLTPQNRCRSLVFERIIRGDYRVTSWSLRE
jgi:hypothetical protein